MTGAILGWVVLGQSLSPLQLTGFAITVAAIAYGASMQARSAGETTEHRPQVVVVPLRPVDTRTRFDAPAEPEVA